MIVVDASVLAKYVLKEKGWERVSSILSLSDEALTLDHALKEVLNAVWKTTVIHGLINERSALEKYEALMMLIKNNVVVVEDESAYLHDALKIALRARLTVYDALYVAQARQHRARLVTSDKGQARAARELGVEVTLI